MNRWRLQSLLAVVQIAKDTIELTKGIKAGSKEKSCSRSVSQWPSGEERTLKLVGCGFDNHNHYLSTGRSIFRVEVWRLDHATILRHRTSTAF